MASKYQLFAPPPRVGHVSTHAPGKQREMSERERNSMKRFSMDTLVDVEAPRDKERDKRPRLSVAEKVHRSLLGTQERRQVKLIKGNTDPVNQQCMVVLAVEQPFEVERNRRLRVPKEHQVMGRVPPLSSFTILPGHPVLARVKDVRSSPQGMPDIQTFSNLAGIDKRDQLMVVGLSLVPQEQSETKSTVTTVALAGTWYAPPICTSVIPAWSRVAINTKALIAMTPEGAVPAYQVQGQDPDTLLPSLEPWSDMDCVVKAHEVDDVLYGTLKDMKAAEPDKWVDKADTALKQKVFNEDGYDAIFKKPIQVYGEWSALYVMLSDLLISIIGAPDADADVVCVATVNVAKKKIAELLREQKEDPNFAKFQSAMGDEVDCSGEDTLLALCDKLTPKPSADREGFAEQYRDLMQCVTQQKNCCFGHQNSWMSRMILGRVTNRVLPGGVKWADFLIR